MTPLAAIHVAKKQLGLDDDTYRAVLVRVTSKDSSKDMTSAEQSAVLEDLRGRGFKPASKGLGKPLLKGPYAKKLQALWIDGFNLGIIHDRRDAALLTFVKGRTGIDHVQFLRHAEDARKAVEALKAWLEREGGVDWKARWPSCDGERVAWAQYGILVPGATVMGNYGPFIGEAQRIAGRLRPNERDWIAVMNVFGERVRKAKA